MGTAPGVIVEEQARLSLSVSASSTVPCFISTWYGLDGNPIEIDKGCMKVNDWLDYCSRFNHDYGSLLGTVHLTSTATDESKTKYTYVIKDATVALKVGSASSLALKNYFENGGGPCYLLSAKDLSTDAAKFVGKIEECPDISLLAMATKAKDTNEADTVYSGLTNLLDKKKGHFLIAHGADKDATECAKLKGQAQVAFYYPYIQLSQGYWVADAEVSVADYMDKEQQTPKWFKLSELKTRNPSLYQQISKKVSDEVAKFNQDNPIPPSAAIAGVYCRTDRERGIWKAPANVTIRGGVPGVRVSEEDHGTLNENGTNVIRWFDGQGAVVYGARTLVDKNTTDWRYVPVRRLFNRVERDVGDAVRLAMFEPNTATTWTKVKAAIDSYLYNIWQLGGLMGARPEEGYFVQVGEGITMTRDDVNKGRMIVKIGMAAVRPAEFIILQFTQDMA